MEDCDHNKLPIPGEFQQEFLGQTFSVKGVLCPDCGAELWTSEIHAQFKEWQRMQSKKKEVRNRMRLEKVQVTPAAFAFLEGLKDAYWICDSRAISALVSVYLISYQHDKAFVDDFTIPVGSKSKTYEVVRLSPALYVKVDSLSHLFNMDKVTLVEEIVNKMAAAYSRQLSLGRYKEFMQAIEIAATV